MWRKRLRKKNWPVIGASPTKVREIGSPKSGRASSIRAPVTASTWAWTSHTITYPVQPQRRTSPVNTTPEIQARARGPQLRPWANIRTAWTPTARSAASDA